MDDNDNQLLHINRKQGQGRQSFQRAVILMSLDSFVITAAFLGAFLLSYPTNYWNWIMQGAGYLPVIVFLGILAFSSVRMYRTLWRYASVDAMLVIFYGTVLAVTTSAVVLVSFGKFVPNWSFFVTEWMLLFLMIGASRFSIRFVRLMGHPKYSKDRRRILIYGAGDVGEMISRDAQQKSQSHNFQVVGFIDDDLTKKGKEIHGVPIFGGREVVKEIVERKKIQEIIVAMPSVPGTEIRDIINQLQNLNGNNVKLRTIPGIPELIDGKAIFEQIRSFDIRDLLRREPIELDINRVERLLAGKSVLVSGAGGSIGTEICRQVAKSKPKCLIIFDISESNLYLILEELSNSFPNIPIIPIVGDISHRHLTERVFTDHCPTIVFHAAAYKHVPLMEQNPWSAVRNNISGTNVLVDVAAKHGIERFVMISTDKAVRPTSIMGATKRICEMLVKAQPHNSDSVFSVVRFGNVMGSSGSVVPKFERQIKDQGIVTVTHPDVTRFFMLTSEAVQLVLQAATLDKDDAIYILDMGEPVKILDLANDMIRLSGLKPDIDIKIEFTGLREGEKLYEELYHLGAGEKSEIEKIWMTKSHSKVDITELIKVLDVLLENCYTMPREDIYNTLKDLVPDFVPTTTLN